MCFQMFIVSGSASVVMEGSFVVAIISLLIVKLLGTSKYPLAINFSSAIFTIVTIAKKKSKLITS